MSLAIPAQQSALMAWLSGVPLPAPYKVEMIVPEYMRLQGEMKAVRIEVGRLKRGIRETNENWNKVEASASKRGCAPAALEAAQHRAAINQLRTQLDQTKNQLKKIEQQYELTRVALPPKTTPKPEVKPEVKTAPKPAPAPEVQRGNPGLAVIGASGKPVDMNRWAEHVARHQREWGRKGVTAELVLRVWAKSNGRCYYTGKQLVIGLNTSLEHLIPHSKGGTDTEDNLVFCDRVTNQWRSNTDEEEFRSMCRLVTEHWLRGLYGDPTLKVL